MEIIFKWENGLPQKERIRCMLYNFALREFLFIKLLHCRPIFSNYKFLQEITNAASTPLQKEAFIPVLIFLSVLAGLMAT